MRPLINGPTVVDAHDNGTSSLLIYDTHSATKGKLAVSRSQRMGVETLTVGSEPAVKSRAVPRRMAALNRVRRSSGRLCPEANSQDHRSVGGCRFEMNEQNAIPSCC